MLHDDTENFLKVLESTSAQTGFPLLLLEKDYYLTMMLSQINTLEENLVFKGGTCLNKVHYSYYRLSEDLDFTLKLPSDSPSRAVKQRSIKSMKDGILSYMQKFGMRIEELDNVGHNESSQYIWLIDYDSAVLEKPQSIKLEVGLRFNPILPTVQQRIDHRFLHPFTKEPLFEGGQVTCLDLKEIVAEKMRATATRMNIAPRDFYDLGFLLKSGYDFQDKQLWKLFRTKLGEDGFDTNLSKYRVNLGRSDRQIEEMSARVEAELMAVLTVEEQRSFDLQVTLTSLNETLKNMA
jgi:predicted nucleotidyltransferase component of viral defense system